MASTLDDYEPIYPGRDYKLAVTEELLTLLMRMKALAKKITNPQFKKNHLDWCKAQEKRLRDIHTKRNSELEQKKPDDDEPIKDLRDYDSYVDSVMKHLT